MAEKKKKDPIKTEFIPQVGPGISQAYQDRAREVALKEKEASQAEAKANSPGQEKYNKPLDANVPRYMGDGTVKFGGQTISEKEWSNLQSGNYPARLSALADLRDKMILKNKIRTKGKENLQTDEVINEILQEESQNQQPQQPLTEEGLQATASDIQTAEEPKPEAINKKLLSPLSNPLSMIPGLVPDEQTFKRELKKSAGDVIGPVLDLVRDTSSFVQVKDSARVKKAKDSFSNINSAIDGQLELISEGFGSEDELNVLLRDAEDAINDLEATSHGRGLLNPSYWTDEGKSIQTQVLEEKKILEVKRAKLEQAKAEAIIKARARYGL